MHMHMTMTNEQAEWFGQTFDRLVANVEQAVLGKVDTIRLAFTCLLAEGHLLLEDVPGTGKTSLAKSIANTVQGGNSRVQFTPDLLPSDLTGVNIYNQQTGTFELHRGPIFTTILLADEINRASPKTQSALLEVMEEQQVTIDGHRYPLEAPFMVIATQNNIEQIGTYRLPEAQLDRFLVRTALGYADHETTVDLLADAGTRNRAAMVEPLITASAVREMAALATSVHIDRDILGYVSRIAEETRRLPEVRLGVSVRGCLAAVRCAKVWAAARARNYVVPDDVQDLLLPTFGHRVLLDPEAEFHGTTTSEILGRIVSAVKPPSGQRS